MSIQYRVKGKEIRAGRYTSEAPRAIRHRQVITWDIHATNTEEITEPAEVTEHHILNLYGGTGDDAPTTVTFPRVNRSIFEYVFIPVNPRPPGPGDGRFYVPWLICNDKYVIRDTRERNLFRMTAEYSTSQFFEATEDDLALTAVPDTVAEYPYLRETVWDSETRVIWDENDTLPGADRKPMRLPTNSMFDEPFRRVHPKRTIRQTQFEVIPRANLDQIIEDRLFSVNNIAIFGDPIPSQTPHETEGTQEPPRWMITAIQFQPVIAPIGQLSAYENDAIMMTYTFERNARAGGWWDRRALIDKYYLQVANDFTTKEPYRDPFDASSFMDASLFRDGTLIPEDLINQQLEFEPWAVQPYGDWSFVKGP